MTKFKYDTLAQYALLILVILLIVVFIYEGSIDINLLVIALTFFGIPIFIFHFVMRFLRDISIGEEYLLINRNRLEANKITEVNIEEKFILKDRGELLVEGAIPNTIVVSIKFRKGEGSKAISFLPERYNEVLLRDKMLDFFIRHSITVVGRWEVGDDWREKHRNSPYVLKNNFPVLLIIPVILFVGIGIAFLILHFLQK